MCVQEVHCVIMVEQELSSISRMYLRHPIWQKRITVLIGTPIRSADLARARAKFALACFIHTPRDRGDGVEAVSPYTLTPSHTFTLTLYRTITPSCVPGLSKTMPRR